MHIAYICADPGVPVFGRKGSSVHVQELLRAFLAHGATIDLFATRFDGEAPADLTTVRCHALPNLPKGDPAVREQAALAANDVLRQAMALNGPYDLVYERYSLWSEAGLAYACAVGIPSVLEVNAPLIEEQARHRSLIDRASAERVAGRVFGLASHLLAVSEGVAAYLAGFPAAVGRIQVVPNGVDPQRFLVERRLNGGGGSPRQADDPTTTSGDGWLAASDMLTVGFVGTLKPWHGLSVLVEAFSQVHLRRPATRLLIVGDGPERAELEADLASHGLSSVTRLTGAVDPAEVPALLAAMDIAVAPYPWCEDFYFSPLKVFEYMAAARPVVSSRIGQLPDLIDHNVTGLLTPPGDSAALAEALLRLVDDAALRERLGQAARRVVIREHAWSAIAGRILGLVGLTSRSRMPVGV